MESKSFVKLLRKIIREEVGLAVRKEMRTMVNERSSNTQPVAEPRANMQQIRKSPKKKSFVKNSMLNDILNETAAGADFSTMRDGPLVQQEGYPNLENTSFTSAAAETFGMQRVQENQPLATHDVNGAPANMANEEVAKTVNLMTKDYSALMKAIDKKKGFRK